jgi:cytochrome P450
MTLFFWYQWPNESLTSISLAVSVLYVSEPIPFYGTTLPRGQDVIVLSRSVTRQSRDVPSGPNNSPPSIFDPCRYLVEDPNVGETVSIFPATKLGGFLGFGHGVRSCPGRTYSEALSYATLAIALQNLTWTLAPNHCPVNFIFDLVMAPDCDIQLEVQRRL